MNLEELMELMPEEVHSILANCDSLTLYALDPNKSGPPSRKFCGHFPLRSTEITDAQEIRRVVVALYQGMTDESAWQTKCFEPHHGVRATFGERSVDFEICYQCRNVYIYLNGEMLPRLWPIAGPSQWLLDDLLKPTAST